MRRQRSVHGLFVALALPTGLLVATAALPATLSVAPGAVAVAPDSVCSLIEAFEEANTPGTHGPDCGLADFGANEISLAAGSTYILTASHNRYFGPNGLPVITSNIAVEGNGATILRDPAAPPFRFFTVSEQPSGEPGRLALTRVTLSAGLAKGGDGGSNGGGGAGIGGAIFNLGRLELYRSTLTDNEARGGNGGAVTQPTGGGGGGGGIGGNGGRGSNDGFGAGGGGGFGGTGGSASSGGPIGNERNHAGGGGGGYTDGFTALVTEGGAGGGGPQPGFAGRGGNQLTPIIIGTGLGGAGNVGGGGGGSDGFFGPGGDGGFGDIGGGGGGAGGAGTNNGCIGSGRGGNGGRGGTGGGGGGGGGTRIRGGNGGAGGFGGGGGGGGGFSLNDFASGGVGGAGGFGGGGGGGGIGFGAACGQGGHGASGAAGFAGGRGAAGSTGGGGGGGAGLGGAIYNDTSASIRVFNSTLSGNRAIGGLAGLAAEAGEGRGGAIFNRRGAFQVYNSTIADNAAAQGGGGVYSGGPLSAPLIQPIEAPLGGGDRNDVDAIVAFARARTAAEIEDDGRKGGSFVMQSSIVADSRSGVTDCVMEANHDTFALRNLIEHNDGCPGATQVSDPRLGPLQDNGGTTPTHALLCGSPAIDGGANFQDLKSDQRLLLREVDGLDDGIVSAVTDIGAFELQAAYPDADQDGIGDACAELPDPGESLPQGPDRRGCVGCPGGGGAPERAMPGHLAPRRRSPAH